MSQSSWDRKFLNLAIAIADWSKDPNVKVGCIMVDRDHNIVCTGYNGFPRGVHDTAERLNNRELKLQMIVHAEANAVAVGGMSRLNGATAYVTRPPCCGCAGLIIQAGIVRVVHLDFEAPSKWQANYDLAFVMLSEAGVIVEVQ